MYFFRRDLLCARLRLEHRQSFRLVGSSRSGLISSDDILGLLNRSRRGIAAALTEIPSDILLPDEVCAETGVTQRELRAWSRRKRNVAPHFRLNGHTRRYPREIFLRWLKANSTPERWS